MEDRSLAAERSSVSDKPGNCRYQSRFWRIGSFAGACEIAVRTWSEADCVFMRRALDLARLAGQSSEVPVGAVLVCNEQILGEGWNRPLAAQDPTAHAEMEAIRKSAANVGNYRLAGATLYVTLEPCVMCAGAIVMARIERLVFAARDLRFGAVRSKFSLADSELLNHRVQVEEGLLATDAANLLSDFFRERRLAKSPGNTKGPGG